MSTRTGDWRDLLSAYTYALDLKKIYVGMLATVATVAILMIACLLYAILASVHVVPADLTSVTQYAIPFSGNDLLAAFAQGRGLLAMRDVAPMLCPFAGGLAHLAFSVLLWLALLRVWSVAGGVISRLTALEYGRDDLPSLHEAREFVRPRRWAYFLAPTLPLLAVVVFAVLNIIGGFLASFWYFGRALLIFPGMPMLAVSTGLMILTALLGLLSYGLMAPAVSVSGKDCYESWSTSFSYVAWGHRRFLCYTLLTIAVGAVVTLIVWALAELLIYGIYTTVNLGFWSGTSWLHYESGVMNKEIGGVIVGEHFRIAFSPVGEGLTWLLTNVIVFFMLLLRALPVAFLFSYLFSANTIVYMLMRKDQDNIDVDEVFEEEDEGEPVGEGERAEAAPSEEQPAPKQAPPEPPVEAQPSSQASAEAAADEPEPAAEEMPPETEDEE